MSCSKSAAGAREALRLLHDVEAHLAEAIEMLGAVKCSECLANAWALRSDLARVREAIADLDFEARRHNKKRGNEQ